MTKTVENRFTRTQSMHADNDTLIITDPCYLLRDEHWEHYCNLEFAGSNNGGGIGLDYYLMQYLDFGEVIAADTGYGDWSNTIKQGKAKQGFFADAGTVCVVTMSDLDKYGADMNEVKRLHDMGGLAIVENFTGEVTLSYEGSEGQGYWAFIEGKSSNGGKDFRSNHYDE